jgi:hypothetical protein
MSEAMDIDVPGPDVPMSQPLESEAETPRYDPNERPPPRRTRNIDETVERVKDETGEMVHMAFLQFLETYTILCYENIKI